MLQPLRGERFVLVFRKNAKVYLDYHVEFQGQFFSVPYHLTRKTVEIRYTACLIEIFHQSDKVATHQRRDGQRYFTNPDHMPPNHRSIAEWSPERFLAWGQRTGCSTGEMVARLLETRAHPEQSFRGCLGLLQGLPRQFTPERVEMACKRALAMGAHSYRSVKSILDRGLDQVEIAPPQLTSAGLHENIRGADYYAEQSGGEA